MNMLTVGLNAPDFTLFSTDKKEVSLSSLRGKNVLILFFPQAFTGVCTKELCSMRDDIANYEGMNCEVLAISVDSVFTLIKFKEENQFGFTLLSDFNKDVSASYHTLYDEFVMGMKGVSKRSAFIVDKEGVLRYVEVLESAGDIPNFEAIQTTLKSLA